MIGGTAGAGADANADANDRSSRRRSSGTTLITCIVSPSSMPLSYAVSSESPSSLLAPRTNRSLSNGANLPSQSVYAMNSRVKPVAR